MMEDTDALPPPPPPLPPDDVEDGTLISGQQLDELATALAAMGQEVQENAFHASPNPFLDHRKVLDLSTDDTVIVQDDVNNGDENPHVPPTTGEHDEWVTKVDTMDTSVSTFDEEEGRSSQGSAEPLPPAGPAADDFSSEPFKATAAPPPSQPKDSTESLPTKVCKSIKYIYSSVLLVFCVTLVMAAIFSGQTNAVAEMNIPPSPPSSYFGSSSCGWGCWKVDREVWWD